MPLPAPGERFPIEYPDLQPIVEPRPISYALFLQGMLEGLSKLEQQGWQRLQELGASPIKRVLTVGGGACNPQWRNLRQLALGIPVLNLPKASAATAMAFLALQSVKVDR